MAKLFPFNHPRMLLQDESASGIVLSRPIRNAGGFVMQERTYTVRQDVHLMPWQIEPSEGLSKTCILVATMNGNEMQAISLHVADPPKHAE
jgi:hypothetical protein